MKTSIKDIKCWKSIPKQHAKQEPDSGLNTANSHQPHKIQTARSVLYIKTLIISHGSSVWSFKEH